MQGTKINIRRKRKRKFFHLAGQQKERERETRDAIVGLSSAGVVEEEKAVSAEQRLAGHKVARVAGVEAVLELLPRMSICLFLNAVN